MTGADPGLNQSRTYLPVCPFLLERFSRYCLDSRPGEQMRNIVGGILDGFLTERGF